VQLLLLHRYADSNNNPRFGWTQDLVKAANYVVEATHIEKFAAGSGEYNEEMKKRAVKIIIPDLFKVAQAYEDLVAPYELWREGSDGALVPLGPKHTWKRCPRPKKMARKRKGVGFSASEGPRDRRSHSPSASVANSDSHSERDVKFGFVPSRESTPGVASTVCDSPMIISASGSFEFPNYPAPQPVLQANDFGSFGALSRSQSLTYVPVPMFPGLPHGMPNLPPFEAMPGHVSTMSAPIPTMPAVDMSMSYWHHVDRPPQHYPTETYSTYHM